jgi:hypothetical protein
MHHSAVRVYSDSMTHEQALKIFAGMPWSVHAHRRDSGFTISSAKSDDLDTQWHYLRELFLAEQFLAVPSGAKLEIDILYEYSEARGLIQEIRPPLALLQMVVSRGCELCISISPALSAE